MVDRVADIVRGGEPGRKVAPQDAEKEILHSIREQLHISGQSVLGGFNKLRGNFRQKRRAQAEYWTLSLAEPDKVGNTYTLCRGQEARVTPCPETSLGEPQQATGHDFSSSLRLSSLEQGHMTAELDLSVLPRSNMILRMSGYSLEVFTCAARPAKTWRRRNETRLSHVDYVGHVCFPTYIQQDTVTLALRDVRGVLEVRVRTKQSQYSPASLHRSHSCDITPLARSKKGCRKKTQTFDAARLLSDFNLQDTFRERSFTR